MSAHWKDGKGIFEENFRRRFLPKSNDDNSMNLFCLNFRAKGVQIKKKITLNRSIYKHALCFKYVDIINNFKEYCEVYIFDECKLKHLKF